MLALRCPLCNAVAPVAVSSPEVFECEACGGRIDVPENAQRQLKAAAFLLKSSDAGARRLSKTQRNALVTAGKGRGVLRTLYGIFLFVALIWAAFSLWAGSEIDFAPVEQVMTCVLGLLPLAVIGVSAWRAFRRLGTRMDELALLCSAVPSVVAGAPLRCRVCAAPIGAEGGSQVVSCGYCAADNIVTVGVLKRALDRHREAATDLESEVKSSLTDINAEARKAWLSALGAAVLAPVIAVGASFMLILVASLIPVEVDAAREYAVVEEDGAPCISAVIDAQTLERRRGDDLYDIRRLPLAADAVRERLRADSFVGRKARTSAEPKSASWTIKKVGRSLGGKNHAVFEERGAPYEIPLEALCLAAMPAEAEPAADSNR